MSLSQTINYTNSANFTFDDTKIEFTGTEAQLKLNDVAKSFVEDFTDDTGFTYDDTVYEFTGGLLQQIDNLPSGTTAVANFNIDENLNYGDGTLTGTLTSPAAIVSDSLDFGTNGYVTYTATSKINAMFGAIKFKYTPDFTGSPSSEITLFNYQNAPADNANKTRIFWDASGFIRLQSYTSTGTQISSGQSFGSKSAVSGTEIEFEFSWDFGPNPARLRLFIDGIQTTEINSFQTRSNDLTSVTLLEFGGNDGVGVSTGSIDDIVLYSQEQHSADYTPGYTVSDFRYGTGLVTLPTFTYTEVGDIQSLDAFDITDELGTLVYNVDGQYFNGSTWVASDDSFSQMNSSSIIDTNLGSLTPSGDSIVVKLRGQENNSTQGSLSQLDLDYTGQVYPIDDPSAVNISFATMDDLLTFSDLSTGTVQYTLVIDGVDTYWNGSIWTVSDGSLAQSNTAADINTNAGSLTWPLDGSSVQIKALLNSPTGQTTPTITSVTFTYDFAPGTIIPPNTTVVFGRLYKPDGTTVLSGTTVSAKTSTHLSSNSGFVGICDTTTTTTATDGDFELPLVAGDYVITVDGKSYTTTIPDQTSININSLVLVNTSGCS